MGGSVGNRNNQISDQRQVIGGNPGEGRARDQAGLHLNFFCDKDMIDAPYWKPAGPGALRNMVI